MRTEDYQDKLSKVLFYREVGKITHSFGLLYEADLPGASIGSLCEIFPNALSTYSVEAEVVGFRDRKVLLMPFETVQGLNNESQVFLKRKDAPVLVGSFLLGKVIDGRGRSLDSKEEILKKDVFLEERSLYDVPPNPLERPLISEPIELGVRAIDGLLTCGYGQRMAILAGSGVGKSVLLGMMGRHAKADVNVIALIGERGREVKEFIERDLGPEGLKRSVVVVSTSDTSPLLRMRGAFLATTVAEFFRDQGKKVLLLMDSVTRFCMAQREISLSLGEPPASKGYTPSVFSSIPKLLERTGMGGANGGSITALYSVLVEGEDFEDPIADAVRSTLDGHLVLSRKIAKRNRYPAIDILQSTSRTMRKLIPSKHLEMADQIKDWIALYEQMEDLIQVGAYSKGSNALLDQAVFAQEKIFKFLKQGDQENSSLENTVSALQSIVLSGLAQSGKR